MKSEKEMNGIVSSPPRGKMKMMGRCGTDEMRKEEESDEEEGWKNGKELKICWTESQIKL